MTGTLDLPGVLGAPDDICLDDFRGRRSWRDFDGDVRRLMAVLADHGVRAGDTVALLMHNRVEYLETVFACTALGVTCVPMNWHMAAEEIAYVLADSGALVVVCDDVCRDLVPSGGPAVVSVDGEAGERIRTGAAMDVAPDNPAGKIMFYTSGTTGRPKGVRLDGGGSVADEFAEYRRLASGSGVEGAGPHLVTGPLYHGAPLMSALLALAAGAPVLIMTRWDAEAFLAHVQEHRVRDTHLVPIMFVRLLRLPKDVRNRYDLSSLVTVHHGAAPVPIPVKHQMIEWFGPVLREYWASTEGGTYTEVTSAEWLRRPGTVGRPINGYEVFAVDDSGTPLPPGQPGTLCLRAPDGGGFRYHGDAAKTAATFSDTLTFSIGDIGYVDEDGYVFLVDRTAEVIISGGVNIYPAEIELCLLEHEAVADAAVYSLPDDEWGETVHAAVVLADPAQSGSHDRVVEETLRAALAERIARFKVPRTFRFVDKLPRTDAGKLNRRHLRLGHRPSA
ncbi:AMP-binding protein [Rhizohabitans arisaemae]|uniref:AMP-binding protein n=1 Tax=Rhizohabitans arisaemae TaxID=2720610 RepID=UPI0024B21214|nr:AMP-binding protein [Rhizohabitans arisaemae]